MSNKTEYGSDLQQLKAIADSAWLAGYDPADLYSPELPADAPFRSAFTPAVVLDLIARIDFYVKQSEQLRSLLSECRAELDGKIASEGGAGKKGRTTAETQGMADCMDMVRQELIEAGVIAASVPPMMIANAVVAHTRAAVSAATKPTSDLSGLLRFRLKPTATGNVMVQGNDGSWVKLADVQSLLATKPAAPADRNDILEEAAKLCEEMEGDMFDQYKGRGKHAPNNPYRADPYMNGQSDGAGQCANAIRAMMSAPAAPMASADAVIEARGQARDFTEEEISTAGRALADRNATLCNVNKDDNWKIYGEEFITDARVALDAIAALRTQAAGAEGADK